MWIPSALKPSSMLLSPSTCASLKLARHMGAEVAGVCSGDNAELVRGLGADHIIDYKTVDFTTNGQRYDVIFDIADATTFRACRASLTPTGRYMMLYISRSVLFQVAWTTLVGGPRACFSIAMGDREGTEKQRELMASGVIRPIMGPRFPLERIADAHQALESGRVPGAVVVYAP